MQRELSKRGGGWMRQRSILPALSEEIDRMGRMFNEFFGREEMTPMAMWGPPMDVSETEDKVIVKADLPGIDPHGLDISVTEDMLTVKGEKKEEKEEKGEYYYSSERKCGEFSRSVRLPSTVDQDKINATYNNGVLRVEMQKVAEARKKIEVKVL